MSKVLRALAPLALLRYTAASPLTIRFVKAETVSSCSWVAWREIGVFGPAGS